MRGFKLSQGDDLTFAITIGVNSYEIMHSYNRNLLLLGGSIDASSAMRNQTNSSLLTFGTNDRTFIAGREKFSSVACTTVEKEISMIYCQNHGPGMSNEL